MRRLLSAIVATTLISACSGGDPKFVRDEAADSLGDAAPVIAVNDPNYGVAIIDPSTREIFRVDVVNAEGEFADAGGLNATISWDGTVVAFDSRATNFPDGYVEDSTQAYVASSRDRFIARISSDTNNEIFTMSTLHVHVSADGNWVVFEQYAPSGDADEPSTNYGVFLFDLETGRKERIDLSEDGSIPDENGWRSSPSAGGRYVVFESCAETLVSGDGNDECDVFVHDAVADSTELVSVASNGEQANGFSGHGSISHDGRLIAFDSEAYNLASEDLNAAADVFVRDQSTGETTRISELPDGSYASRGAYGASMLGDGSGVVFIGDSRLGGGDGNAMQVLLYTFETEEFTVLSASPDGDLGNADSISAEIVNDRYVVFVTNAWNLVPESQPGPGEYIYDLDNNELTRIR